MRLFALQTDIKELKKQFLAEGEKEILSTVRHPLIFLISMVNIFLLSIVYAAVIVIISLFLNLSPFLSAILLAVSFPYFFLLICNALISWRYNALIVTTEKIILVAHRSFFHQDVDPIHLQDVERTKFTSQFFGIFRCGSLCILLKEREGGTTREANLRYVPQPDVVASAIENAIALAKQRPTQGETAEEHREHVQKVQEKIQESVRKESPTTPAVETPVEPAASQSSEQPAMQELQQKVPELEAQVQQLQEDVKQLKQEPPQPEPQLGTDQ